VLAARNLFRRNKVQVSPLRGSDLFGFFNFIIIKKLKKPKRSERAPGGEAD
jgi:hypothetical protein